MLMDDWTMNDTNTWDGSTAMICRASNASAYPDTGKILIQRLLSADLI